MEEGKYDLISSLPHDVLKRIISFLPLEQAMKTSLLSTVWRSLWVPVEVNLDEANREVKQIVDLFSKSYGSHRVWKLCLSFEDSRRSSSSEITGETIAFAAKGVDEELVLEFSDRQLVTNICLKLEACCFSPALLGFPSQAATSFSTLKMLHVRSLSDLSKDVISALFSSSHFLESFKLEKCNGLQILEIEANDFLRSVKVIDCPDMVSISVSATKLTSFWYQGILPDQFQVKNTSNLVEVVLDLRNGTPGCREFDCEDVISLLDSLKYIEILRVSGWLLEWLCSAGVIFRMLDFEFKKLKELSWMDSIMNNTKRDSLACFLNVCPSLEKLLIQIDPNRGSLACPYFHHYWHEPHLWMDQTAVKSNTSELEHLKGVEFMGYTNEEDQLLLIDILLKKASLLKSVTVTSPEHQSWQVAKIPEDQSELNQTWQSSNNQQKQNAVLSLTKGFLSRIFGGIENNFVFCPQKAGICDLNFWF